jgi:glutamate-1-semialdehyde 2,1-aminomutase
MFRLHPRTTTPKSYRKAYQGKKEKAVMVKILDHLFYEENIIMVNTGTAMLSTAITGKEVDQLSQGMLNAFKLTRDELINVQDDPRG